MTVPIRNSIFECRQTKNECTVAFGFGAYKSMRSFPTVIIPMTAGVCL